MSSVEMVREKEDKDEGINEDEDKNGGQMLLESYCIKQ